MTIALLGARGAQFNSGEALAEFRDEALAYERLVADYALHGCEQTLAEGLQALGFERYEIAQHVARPGWRMPRGF